MKTALLNAIAILIACAAMFAIEYRGPVRVEPAKPPIATAVEADPGLVHIDRQGMVTYRPNLFMTLRYPVSQPRVFKPCPCPPNPTKQNWTYQSAIGNPAYSPVRRGPRPLFRY